MIRLKNSIGCVLLGLFFVMLASERRFPSPVAVPVSESTCAPTIAGFPGITPMRPGEHKSPSLASMIRRDSVRDFLAGKSNVVYGDIGNWSPTERETKHPSDIDPSLMQPLPFSGEAIPLPTACPAEH